MNLQKTDTFAARLLMMSFFLQDSLQVLAAIGPCAYFVFRTFGIKEYPPAKNYLWALLLGGGYLMYIIAIPLTATEHRQFIYTLLERRASFLLLPLVFATIAPTFRILIMGQLMYFVIGCIIACAVGNGVFLYHHFILGPANIPLSHVVYRNVFENTTGVHPTYMSMYLCLAVCITLLLCPSSSRGQVFVKFGTLNLLLLLMLALFAKAPIIALVLIAIHFLWGHRHMMYQFKWAFIGLFATAGATYLFVPFFRQRAGEMLGLFHSGKNENIIQNSVNMRQLLWDTDTNMLQHYWLTGIGPGRMIGLLQQRYFFHSIHIGYWVGYFDPHNQYFYDWLSFGIAGILLLVIVLIVQFVAAAKLYSKLYLYFLILIAVTFFTESLLGRQWGILFYSVFTSLFFFSSLQKADLK